MRSPHSFVRGWPLRRKAYALLVLAAGIPPLVVAGLLLHHERAVRRSGNEAVLRARVDEVGHTLEALHRGYAAAAARAAADPAIVRFCGSGEEEKVQSRPFLQERISIVRGDDPSIRGLGILDLRGEVIASTEDELIGTNLAYRTFFQRALAGETSPDLYVSIPVTGRVPTVAFAAPVRRGERVVGVYVIWVRAQTIWEVMRGATGLAGAGSYFILFDEYGVRIGNSLNPDLIFRPAAPLAPDVARSMLASRRFQERTAELLGAVVPFPLEFLGHTEATRFRRLSPVTRVWNLGVSRYFPSLRWTLVAMVPESVMDVGVASVVPKVLPATLLGLALALLGGVLLVRTIVSPIRSLATAAAALERGEFSGHALPRFAHGAGDELSELSSTFLAMTESLAERDRSLRARNGDLKQVLDSMGQGLLAADPAGDVAGVQSAVVETWFGKVTAGEPIWRYLGQEDKSFVGAMEQGWRGLLDGTLQRDAAIGQLPTRLQRRDLAFDLAYRPVEAEGRLERVILVITDVTEVLAKERAEQQLEAELRQAQKLEAVGRIASGIAHEINTPTQYVGDGTRFVERAFGSVVDVLSLHQEALRASAVPAEVQERLRNASEAADLDYLVEEVPRAIAQVLEGVQRISTIVRAMKEFAHPDQNEMVATDLNRALSATLEISRNEYKYVAEVERDFGEIPQICCYAGDLNQVFLNIIVNAAHAIEDVVKETGGKGSIRVRTSLEDGQVVVAISDTGCGIPDSARDKIFEPFFTTKPVGRGTGQGLAIARSVVKNHGGQLTFTTEVGRGTTFFVRLPVAPKKGVTGPR